MSDATRAALVACLAAACSSKSSPAPAAKSGVTARPGATLVEEPIEFKAGERTVRGTLARPDTPGRHPAVVLLAGSGATDRDWTNPLMAGTNGSGKLLARELATRGVIVLRYDKLGTGTTDKQPLTFPLGAEALESEPRAAVGVLVARPDVDPAHVFVAGHSEGGIYAIRLAAADPRVTGLMLLSSAGRAMKDLILAQLDAQGRFQAKKAGLADGDELVTAQMKPIRADLDAYFAGTDVDATKYAKLPIIATILSPATAPLTREIYGYDPITGFAKLTGKPVLIVNGGKDVQVSPSEDAERLATAARAAHLDVTLTIAPDADHVLKHEPKPRDELYGQASTEADYNADGRTLDPVVVTTIVDWLIAHTR